MRPNQLTPLAVGLVMIAACAVPGTGDGSGGSSTSGSGAPETSAPPPELPGGGRVIFPGHRLVGFSGGRSPAFGRLAPDDLDDAAEELEDLGAAYTDGGVDVLPVFELITVVAHDSPTRNGLYRTFEPDELIEDYLDAAREHGALLLLNIQPGRSDFLETVKALERWLREPDVGLALDPEWAVAPDEVPGRSYGSTTGAELDSVAAYLSTIVADHDLPEKVMVFHQVHASVVLDETALRTHPGVVTIKSIDGIGARANKESTWRTLMPTTPPHVRPGFKLFFDEDTEHGALMTPEQVLALTPTPDYVLYE